MWSTQSKEQRNKGTKEQTQYILDVEESVNSVETEIWVGDVKETERFGLVWIGIAKNRKHSGITRINNKLTKLPSINNGEEVIRLVLR